MRFGLAKSNMELRLINTQRLERVGDKIHEIRGIGPKHSLGINDLICDEKGSKARVDSD